MARLDGCNVALLFNQGYANIVVKLIGLRTASPNFCKGLFGDHEAEVAPRFEVDGDGSGDEVKHWLSSFVKDAYLEFYVFANISCVGKARNFKAMNTVRSNP